MSVGKCAISGKSAKKRKMEGQEDEENQKPGKKLFPSHFTE